MRHCSPASGRRGQHQARERRLVVPSRSRTAMKGHLLPLYDPIVGDQPCAWGYARSTASGRAGVLRRTSIGPRGESRVGTPDATKPSEKPEHYQRSSRRLCLPVAAWIRIRTSTVSPIPYCSSQQPSFKRIPATGAICSAIVGTKSISDSFARARRRPSPNRRARRSRSICAEPRNR
jgi:hypothetical protein